MVICLRELHVRGRRAKSESVPKESLVGILLNFLIS